MAHQLADVDDVCAVREHVVDLGANDVETLLVSWLGELIYLGERDDVVFTEIEPQTVTHTGLRATVRGGPAVERRRIIKAVTFSDLEVRRTAVGYTTVIVFDV
jgi:SHS2 domain-containing protein